jgi:phosphatidylglycerophosphate synthase
MFLASAPGCAEIFPSPFSLSGTTCLNVDTYQPTSRRPIADLFRRTAHAAVRGCVHAGIHPDTISYLSMVAAGCAAVCFWQSHVWPWLLLVGPAFCYLRLWCNMLDGMVALASKTASARGEILNDLPDRVSDVVIFVGVAHSGLCSPFAGYWAAIFAVFTAYVGMLGQAVGAKREFGGIMSKPWRMVVLHLGAWILFGVATFSGQPLDARHLGLTVLDWTCLIVIAGCIQTVFVRLRQTLRVLSAKKSPQLIEVP